MIPLELNNISYMVGFKKCNIYWCTPVIPTLWRLRQENDFELLDCLAILMRACLEKTKEGGGGTRGRKELGGWRGVGRGQEER